MNRDGVENYKISDFVESLKNTEDRELVVSLAMMEIPETEDILKKSVALMKRIVQVRSRNDNHLTNKIKNAEQGGDPDLPLELLRQKQQEIRALRGL